jgi:hypothetical protein
MNTRNEADKALDEAFARKLGQLFDALFTSTDGYQKCVNDIRTASQIYERMIKQLDDV